MQKIRRFIKRTKVHIFTIVLIFIAVAFQTTTLVGGPFTTTNVSINPSSQSVSSGDSFSINVYCVPGQPIKSFELELSFDSTLLQVTSVSEGNIFSGYPTFFSPGTIDNTAGTIADVYNLIIGSGNVSSAGTLVGISFVADSSTGTSDLELYDIGVTNETEYVTLSVSDGSVTVQGSNSPPYTPSNPNPSDGGSNVDLNADLSWSGGDPNPGDTVLYDVYFEAGDSSPDVLVSNDQSGTTYNTGTMNDNTHYYWQIKSTDNHGVSKWSPVWDFTTESIQTNNPPNTPSNPNPSDGGSNVDLNADLSWSGGDPNSGDSVVYDVYFGTSASPPLVASSQTGTHYNQGVMNSNTHYYWRIVSRDNHGASTSGPVWDFTTESIQTNNPPNTPSSPSPQDGGTNVATSYDLSWSGGDPDSGDTVTYDVYFEAGDSTPDDIVSNDQSSTSFDPGGLNGNTHYYWRIRATDNHGASRYGPVWDFTTISTQSNDPPYIPKNPNPPNGANNIDPNIGLSWSGGDPDHGDSVVYDVYFEAGDRTPDVLVSNDQSSTTFDPGTMNSNTHYYWRIRATDNHGKSTWGSIWSFRTQSVGINKPPGKPSIPNGFKNRNAKESGAYSTSAIDPDGDKVQYRIDWDSADGHDYSEWTSLVSSSDLVSISHSWTDAGSYVVKSQARDYYGSSSEWSDGLTVEVSGSLSSPISQSPSNPSSQSSSPNTEPVLVNEAMNNNPPDQPDAPLGPEYIEIGVDNSFTILTVDLDDDKVRYMFDWGDGSFSNWSNFVDSYVPISMAHHWISADTFQVKGLSQDENGLNSNWSTPLNVTIVQAEVKDLPAIDLGGPYNSSLNKTIVFDASNMVDPEGVLFIYFWDYGDGGTGTGMKSSHVYTIPGKYIVTLIVFDEQDNSYTTSMVVTIASYSEIQGVKEESRSAFGIGEILIVLAFVLILCLLVIYRKNIRYLLFVNIIPLFSRINKDNIKEKFIGVDDRIKDLFKIRLAKYVFRNKPVSVTDAYVRSIQDRYDNVTMITDSQDMAFMDKKQFFDGSDRLITGDMLDKLVDIELALGVKNASTENKIVDHSSLISRIDALIKSEFDRLQWTDDFDEKDIERIVDDLFLSISDKQR